MSNLNAARTRRGALPAAPPGHPIASYRTYLEAQRAVDYLSDEKFAVQYVSIVGTDLKMVERVTGRLTYGRVAAAGALSGAYFGSFVGLLLALFSSQPFDITVVLAATVIGVGFGVMFGVISYAATGGRRDFTSTSQIVAAQYAVWCADEQAAEATRVLAGLDNGVRGGQKVGDPGSVVPQGGGSPAAPGGPGGSYPDPATRVDALPPPVTGPTYSEMLAKNKAAKAADEADRQRQAQQQSQSQSHGRAQDSDRSP